MTLEREVWGYPVRVEAVKLNEGWDIAVYGGSSTHVGAVSLGEIDGTTQTMEREHHRDSEISRVWARELARSLQTPICVRCGIHYDQATKDQIKVIVGACDELLQELIQNLKGSMYHV